MRIKLAAAAGALALGGVIAGGAVANAATPAGVSGAVVYVSQGSGAVAGVFASESPAAAANGAGYQHITGYLGNDGQNNLAQLDAATIPGTITNAAGLGLCNQVSGVAAQLGVVYVGDNMETVVAATGHFTSDNGTGDLCKGGVVNPSELQGRGYSFHVLGTYPVNDTLSGDIEYSNHSGSYSIHGHHGSRGDVIFDVTDLSAHQGVYAAATSHIDSEPAFNEADLGTVVNDATVVPLGTNLAPLGNDTHGHAVLPSSDSKVITFAHVKLTSSDTGQVASIQSGTWNVQYVASDKNGGKPGTGNPLYAAPSQFFDDNTSIYEGLATN